MEHITTTMDGYDCRPEPIAPRPLDWLCAEAGQEDDTITRADLQGVSDFVQNTLIANFFPKLPRDWDDLLRFTFYGRCMPEDWLWQPDRLLPVVVSVGTLMRGGGIVPLRPAPESPIGYMLADGEHMISEAMVAAALSAVAPTRHYYYKKGDPHRIPTAFGRHMETMYAVDNKTFWAVAKAQGLPAVWPGYRMLSEKFLDL